MLYGHKQSKTSQLRCCHLDPPVCVRVNHHLIVQLSVCSDYSHVGRNYINAAFYKSIANQFMFHSTKKVTRHH